MDESVKSPKGTDSDEIVSDYANNTSLEQTIWDLKLIFGEFSQRSGSVRWHTSITMPWAQAKILSHYLQVNIAVWELHNGPIKVPDAMIPPPLPPLTPEQEKDPAAKALFETIKAYQDPFVERLRRRS